MRHLAFAALIIAFLVEMKVDSYVITDGPLPLYLPDNGRLFWAIRDSHHVINHDYDVTNMDDFSSELDNNDYMEKETGDGGEIFEQYGDFKGMPNMTPVTKRVFLGNLSMKKRIHTCAFMRRLGLPIGLCFKGIRVNLNKQTPKAPVPETKPTKDAYAYLERSWPVHSMLGGGVGR